MEVRIQRNFNIKTKEELFGISIRLDNGHRYCKYPIEHQEYKTISDAKQAKDKVIAQFCSGAHIQYSVSGTKGINMSEYVKIVDSNR